MRWTAYMDTSLEILAQGQDTPQDVILAAQVKCQLIVNQVTLPDSDKGFPQHTSPRLTKLVKMALLERLNNIRQSLSPEIISQSKLCIIHHLPITKANLE